MLASLTELRSYYVEGTDGQIGRIADLGFREDEWIVRYVVVDLEDLGRQALLLSAYLGHLDRATHTLSADIRRGPVANAPPFDRGEPLTRQDEQELHDLYGWPAYGWEQEHEITPIGGLWDEPVQESENPDEPDEAGPELLFVGDLTEIYGVQSEGGEIGVLHDVIVQDEGWTLPYLVIDVESSGRRVLLASDYVQTIDMEARRIHVSVPRAAVINSPVISSEEPVTPELEQSLREYYDPYLR
jgi:hypothetical protein